jgi:hypothetical protein
MCRQIHQAAQDPLVQTAAMNALRFQGGPFGFTPAEACWCWCKHYLRFKHHGSMFEAWSADLGDPRTKLQLLIAPDVLVRMSRMEGDCAIYTMMLAAMLESLGLRWEIVTAAVDRGQPDIFSHVWPRVVLPGGAESLDASHGKYPGWQVPAEDVHRMWVFDQNGSRISEQGAQFGGLHAYRRRPGMRGMGTVVCDETGSCYDDGTTAAGGVTLTPVGCTCVNGTCVEDGNSCSSGPAVAPQWVCPDGSLPPASGVCPSGSQTQGYTAPAQNSAQWASFATQLMKSGMTLAEINAIQPGTVVAANGAILRQSTGYAVPVGSSVSTTLSSMSSSTLLMIGGLALVAVLFMGGKR